MPRRGYSLPGVYPVYADTSDEARSVVRSVLRETGVPARIDQVEPDSYGSREFRAYEVYVWFRDDGEQWAFETRWNL